MASHPVNESDELPFVPEVYRTAIRVSEVGGRDKADYSGTFRSPEDQLKQGKRFAEARGGIHDDDRSWQNAELNVSGFSRKFTERKNILQHLADAKAGKFQHIIFTYTDRASRGVADGILLDEAFRDAGVQVHYLDNPGSPETDETFETRRDFNFIVSAELSRRARRRTNKLIRERTAEGLPHGDTPAWIAIDETKKTTDLSRFTIDEAVAPVYQRMVELRLEMKGWYMVAKTLNQDGLRTKSGKQWTASHVMRCMSEHYLRRMEGDSSITVSGRKNAKDAGETTWLPNVYPALITRETGDQVRLVGERLKDAHPKSMLGKRGRGISGDNAAMLAGKILCGQCGKVLQTSWGQKTVLEDGSNSYRRTYRCFKGGTDADHPGGAVNLSSESIDDAVERVIRYVMTETPKAAMPPKRRGRKAPEPKPVETMAQYEEQLARLRNLHVLGYLTIDEFERDARPIREKVESLRQESKVVIDEEGLYAAALAALTSLGESESASETEAISRRLVLYLVDTITAPVDLPEGAACINESDPAEILKSTAPFRTTGKNRRFARIKFLWNINGHGTEFYAPLYRLAYEGKKLFFRAPEGDPAK